MILGVVGPRGLKVHGDILCSYWSVPVQGMGGAHQKFVSLMFCMGGCNPNEFGVQWDLLSIGESGSRGDSVSIWGCVGLLQLREWDVVIEDFRVHIGLFQFRNLDVPFGSCWLNMVIGRLQSKGVWGNEIFVCL